MLRSAGKAGVLGVRFRSAGYYDQSHFIREFRRFVGCTPSEFTRERGGLAAALVESA